VEGDQGVVGADLHPQITVAAGCVEAVGGEGGQRVQGGRALLPQAGAVEEAVAEAEVIVSEDGPASRATSVSPWAAGSPAISRSAVVDQRRSRAAASVRPAPGARSKAMRWPRACRGSVMPG
jgi:hypothetical protein